MEGFPLVSICMSSYNNAHYVVETLNSFTAQTYPNLEIVVVDDCSKDDSVAVIRNWLAGCSIPHHLVQHEQNRGVCRVANSLIEHASGKYVSIIASDDVLHPEKISSQVALLEKAGPGHAMAYSNVWRMSDEGVRLPEDYFTYYGTQPVDGAFLLPLLKGNFIPGMSALIRRDVFAEVGPFDESLSFEDWDMWLRIARQYNIIYSPQFAGSYRVHSRSLWRNRNLRMYQDIIKLLAKHQGVSEAADQIIREQMISNAEIIYQLGDHRSSQPWLRLKWQHQGGLNALVLWLGSTLGIPFRTFTGLKGAARRLGLVK
ncbi:glycosyltransferase family 2 protein [Hymenobacter sp. B81]|uniref:glycosyltransferase family 2 protein n=1 Tax=Hymenobacter sp. B81 TaxID=3344878 RepID=UPI0037DD4618